MNIKNKPLPRFEVPSSYEKYAEGGYLMDVREPEADSFGDRKPTIASGAGAAAVDPAAIVQGAAVDAEYELPDEPTFADRVNMVVMCVGSQNALREALYKTLAFCQQPHEFTEVEAFIAQTDEFVYSHIMQTPFSMIQMLIDAGGLSQTPLDGEGSPIAEEQLANLSEDEADDLIATYRIQATAPASKPCACWRPSVASRRSFPCVRIAATPISPCSISARSRASSRNRGALQDYFRLVARHRGRSSQAFARLLRRQARQGRRASCGAAPGLQRRGQAHAASPQTRTGNRITASAGEAAGCGRAGNSRSPADRPAAPYVNRGTEVCSR